MNMTVVADNSATFALDWNPLCLYACGMNMNMNIQVDEDRSQEDIGREHEKHRIYTYAILSDMEVEWGRRKIKPTINYALTCNRDDANFHSIGSKFTKLNEILLRSIDRWGLRHGSDLDLIYAVGRESENVHR